MTIGKSPDSRPGLSNHNPAFSAVPKKAKPAHSARTSGENPTEQNDLDAWSATGAVSSLSKFANSIFSGLTTPKTSIRPETSASSVGKLTNKDIRAHQKSLQSAIEKPLVVAMEMQGKGDFESAYNLVVGLVQTANTYGLDAHEIIETFPITISTTSLLFGDEKTFKFLIDNGLATHSKGNPDPIIASVEARNVIQLKYTLNSGKDCFSKKILSTSENTSGQGYELSGENRAIASALLGTGDIPFIVEACGTVHVAAKMALIMGDASAARNILASIENENRDPSISLPGHLQPPPAYRL